MAVEYLLMLVQLIIDESTPFEHLGLRIAFGALRPKPPTRFVRHENK
jgi:hypothetical protein